ncbi:MAG: hypothetical protein JXB88_06105, partial [Spirochaetales bacterium]|nr:hypothetical protein [Spirochaetales bacterium]
EGADREKDMPVAVLKGQNQDGRAEVKWRYSIAGFVFDTYENPVIPYLKERLGIEVDPVLFKYYIEDYEEPFSNPIDKTAKFYFTCKSFRCGEEKSDTIEIGDNIEVKVMDDMRKSVKNVEFTLIGADGKKIEEKTGESGEIKKQALIPGKYQVRVKFPEE